MAIDLKIIVPYNGKNVFNGKYLGHSMLSLDRDSDLFASVIDSNRLKSVAPNKVSCYLYYDNDLQTDTYGDIDKDSYGDELLYIQARDLYDILIQFHHSPMNEAIEAFVKALPDDWPIILYWS